MERKGLCLTCQYGKTCVFSRKSEVLFCEEFYADGSRAGLTKLGLCTTGRLAAVNENSENLVD